MPGRFILIVMADVFFSSSWRILEPYGRARLDPGRDLPATGPESGVRMGSPQRVGAIQHRIFGMRADASAPRPAQRQPTS